MFFTLRDRLVSLHHLTSCSTSSLYGFIIVADETHYCCVISELGNVVGFRLGKAVMGEERERLYQKT